MRDLKEYDIAYPQEAGFVVAVKYKDEEEKSKIIYYCTQNSLPFTECPRYIRLNQPAISIEVKQLQNEVAAKCSITNSTYLFLQ